MAKDGGKAGRDRACVCKDRKLRSTRVHTPRAGLSDSKAREADHDTVWSLNAAQAGLRWFYFYGKTFSGNLSVRKAMWVIGR